MRLRNIPGAKDEIAASPFVVHEPEKYKSCWREKMSADGPLFLEIGMGKGRFIMEMAASYPQTSFVGIEMYSSVLLRAIQQRELMAGAGVRFPNLVFLRMDARQLQEIFAPGEVDRIFLNFSDPWPKERHAHRRLTSGLFLERYAGILSPGAAVEFKTDDRSLFDFSLEEAARAGWQLEACTWDLHRDPVMMKGNVMTEYEQKFSAKGNPIFKMIIHPPAD